MNGYLPNFNIKSEDDHIFDSLIVSSYNALLNKQRLETLQQNLDANTPIESTNISVDTQ